jgi:hypothetical protein
MQVKYKKKIDQKNARRLSKHFCNDFDIQYCDVYYVDRLNDAYGEYIYLNPPHMLILDKPKVINKIGIVIHELTHHLVAQDYINEKLESDTSEHGKYYQLAKKRVIRWCKKNISEKPNWKKPLGKYQHTKDMKKFKL